MMDSYRYRKKSVVVEAFRLGRDEPPSWWFRALDEGCVRELPRKGWEQRRWLIETLEGRVFAQEGDWVIKGVAGELYPCADHVFTETYEPAT